MLIQSIRKIEQYFSLDSNKDHLSESELKAATKDPDLEIAALAQYILRDNNYLKIKDNSKSFIDYFYQHSEISKKDWENFSRLCLNNGNEYRFAPTWKENFQTFNTKKWQMAAWTFDYNSCEFSNQAINIENNVMGIGLSQKLDTNYKFIQKPFIGGEYFSINDYKYGRFSVDMKPYAIQNNVSSFFLFHQETMLKNTSFESNYNGSTYQARKLDERTIGIFKNDLQKPIEIIDRTEMITTIPGLNSLEVGIVENLVNKLISVTDWAEIDFEFIGKTNQLTLNLIYMDATGQKKDNTKQIYLNFDAAKDFHKYTIEWTPTYIAFYLDNQIIDLCFDQNIMKEYVYGLRVAFNKWILDTNLTNPTNDRRLLGDSLPTLYKNFEYHALVK